MKLPASVLLLALVACFCSLSAAVVPSDDSEGIFLDTLDLPASGSAPSAGATLSINAWKTLKDCRTDKYRDKLGATSVNPMFLRMGCKVEISVTITGPVSPKGVKAVLLDAWAKQTVPLPLMQTKPTMQSGNSFVLSVEIGDAAAKSLPVGQYSLGVVSLDTNQVLATYGGLINLVYNPYIAVSPTYLDIPAKLTNLIEEEEGVMWLGSSANPYWVPWAYDQYSYHVWTGTFAVLRSLTKEQRSDITRVVREVSAKVSTDVLEGKWGSEGYEDADTKPWEWSSSAKIFQIFNEQHRPAKYGQCMIYSVLTASIFRVLGVGARQSTGYDFVQGGKDLVVHAYFKPDEQGNQVWDHEKNTGVKFWYVHFLLFKGTVLVSLLHRSCFHVFRLFVYTLSGTFMRGQWFTLLDPILEMPQWARRSPTARGMQDPGR